MSTIARSLSLHSHFKRNISRIFRTLAPHCFSAVQVWLTFLVACSSPRFRSLICHSFLSFHISTCLHEGG